MVEAPFKVDGEVVAALRNAIHDCSERGLLYASKWYVRRPLVPTLCLNLQCRAAELLSSLPPSKRQPNPPVVAPSLSNFHTSTPARSRSPRPSLSFVAQTPAHPSVQDAAEQSQVRHPVAPPFPGLSTDVSHQEAEWEAHDADYLAMAKTFLEAKEFMRVIHWLKPCRSSKAIFLRVYSQYLVNTSV